LRVFLSEAVLLGAAGGLIGCVSGGAVSELSESLAASLFEMPIAVQFSMETIGFGFLFALALATLSEIYPCWRATSYRPVECLRYE